MQLLNTLKILNQAVFSPFPCASLFLYTLFTHQGLQVDDETEVLLGKFIFDVQKSEIQTFHLQVCLSLG